MNELGGMAELARLLSLSRQRVQQLANKEGFPEPVAVLEMGKIWHLRDVRQWADRTNRAMTSTAGQTAPGIPSGRRPVVGAAELAQQLAVSRQRVQQIVGKATFPRPAATLTMGRIWYEDECQEWDRARKHGRASH